MKRTFAVLLFILISLGGPLPDGAAGAQVTPTIAPAPTTDTVIVRFDGVTSATTSQQVAALLNRYPLAAPPAPIGLANGFRITLQLSDQATALAADLEQSPIVQYAEADAPVTLDPLAASQPTSPANWALDAISARDAWPLSEGTGVTVAVLDTGVSFTHPELSGRLLPGYDFVEADGNPTDDAGHGTFVAGIIAAAHDERGTDGLAPAAAILPVKVLDAHGIGSTASFVAGIVYAADAGARVINISASGVSNSRALADAVAYAEAHGAVVVASAGNEPDGIPSYPAALPGVLGVGATDRDDHVTDFSAFGPFVDLTAPGKDVLSTWWTPAGDGYATASGTSAATPFVSAAAALVLAADPAATPPLVRQRLTETATDIDAPGIDARSGNGRLDAFAATRVAGTDTIAPRAAVEITRESGSPPALWVSGAGFDPYEPVMAWTRDGGGRLRVVRGLVADGLGLIAAQVGTTVDLEPGDVTVGVAGIHSGVAATGGVRIDPVAQHPAFAAVPPFESTGDRAYFPETGHSLAFGFKHYWESHGGLSVFGYPISEEFSEVNPDTGIAYTVQYFERNRFEYHPENAGTEHEVLLGRLGAQLSAQAYPTCSAACSTDAARYFPETGHTLTAPFAAYWEANGGLAAFGYPISEPFEEAGRLVQYFERNRFEYHPELPAEHQVLLGRLGESAARALGYLAP